MTVVHRLAGATPDETVLSRLLTESLFLLATDAAALARVAAIVVLDRKLAEARA